MNGANIQLQCNKAVKLKYIFDTAVRCRKHMGVARRDAIMKNLLSRSDDGSIEDVFEINSLGALRLNIHTIHAAATQV